MRGEGWRTCFWKGSCGRIGRNECGGTANDDVLAGFFDFCKRMTQPPSVGKDDSSGSPSKRVLKQLDVSMLVPVEEVPLPPILDTEPKFTCAPGWLEETVSQAVKQFEAKDEYELRVPPMALVRCSRGGKTRALRETARLLKARNIPVLFVSFNDYTPLKMTIMRTPLALCIGVLLLPQ